MALTKEQWGKIESDLESPWGRVRLRIDGYDVQLEVRQIKPMRFAIVVFVNGWSRGEWLNKPKDGEWCEEARRFLPVRKCYLYSRTRLQKLKLPKKMREEIAREHIEVRGVWWTSFAAMKRHLIANNQSIEYAGAVDEAR